MSYQDDYNRDDPPPFPPERNANDDPYRDDRDRFATPQQGGMSKGCMYVMAGCGCLTVLALIAAGVLGWMAVRWAKTAVSMDLGHQRLRLPSRPAELDDAVTIDKC